MEGGGPGAVLVEGYRGGGWLGEGGRRGDFGCSAERREGRANAAAAVEAGDWRSEMAERG